MKKYSNTHIISCLYTQDLLISKGYILWGPNTVQGKSHPDDEPLQAAGGSYGGGQELQSLYKLSNIGPLVGCQTLTTNLFQISNYLSSLIPGQYPTLTGPFTSTQDFYDLDLILDEAGQPGEALCKVLGLGQGHNKLYKIAEVSRNGTGAMANQTLVPFALPIRDYATIDPDDFLITEKVPSLKIANISTIFPDQISPQTEIIVGSYMGAFDWPTKYGLTQLNGTNTFPTMGWGGGLLGSIDTKTFRNQQESLFVWPQGLLPANPYIPVGIVFAGQGCQYVSYTVSSEKTYQEKPKNTSKEYERKDIAIAPYQQGRGIYEIVTREPEYRNGIVQSLDILTTFPPEGAVPGRNVAFAGVSLTDYWGELNLYDQRQGARTSLATRLVDGAKRQTKTAHNAPLAYINDDPDNPDNTLPWNNIMAYQGNTGQTASNKKSAKSGNLTHGVTTMVVSGAYPCYRGTWSPEFSGRVGTTSFGAPGRYYSRYLSQYYLSTDFWDPDLPGEIISADLTDKSMPVEPKPPYRIKGGRIILYEGQRVIAGSYVYTTIAITGNVNISKFYPDGAKELLLRKGNQNYLLSDIYSKYQSNQGGVIVLVTEDNRPPPMPPPNALPIGIVLETIEGTGEPQTIEGSEDYPIGTTEVVFQTSVSTDVQTAPVSLDTTLHISNRDILVMIWPMTPNFHSSGIPTACDVNGIPYGTTVGTYMIGNDPDFYDTGTETYDPPFMAPLYARIRTNYCIPDSRYSWIYSYASTQVPSAFLAAFGSSPASQYGLKDREMATDWPGPHSGKLDGSCTVS